MLINKAAMCRRKCLRPLQLIQIMLDSRRRALNNENRIIFCCSMFTSVKTVRQNNGGLSSLCFI